MQCSFIENKIKTPEPKQNADFEILMIDVLIAQRFRRWSKLSLSLFLWNFYSLNLPKKYCSFLFFNLHKEGEKNRMFVALFLKMDCDVPSSVCLFVGFDDNFGVSVLNVCQVQ